MLITIFAKLGNLSRSGVRFLENQGVLTPRHDENGYRVFSGDDFMRLKPFQRYRDLGFSQREALEMAATGPQERAGRLRGRREELTRAYEETLALLDQEICRAKEAEQPDEPRLATRPALYALPTCDVTASEGAGADASRKALERDGVRWWNELPDVAFGLLTHAQPDGSLRAERCALLEAPGASDDVDGRGGENAPGDTAGAADTGEALDRARYLSEAELLPPRPCLRMVMGGSPSGDPSAALRVAQKAARELGVTICEDGAVSRELFLQLDGPDLAVFSETWFPLVGNGVE